MTWNDCKQTAYFKMFASTAGTVAKNSAGNKDYAAAMPSAANEAMERICALGKPLRKSAEIETAGRGRTIKLNELLPDFRSMGGWLELYRMPEDDAEEPEMVTEAKMVAGTMLVLPEAETGTLLLCYDANPEHVNDKTADDFEMPLEEDANVLIPLYMAAELYKDDSKAMASIYMTEFESKLEDLKRREKGIVDSDFVSVTGWC